MAISRARLRAVMGVILAKHLVSAVDDDGPDPNWSA
jgi:hypothetical protein